MSIFAVTSSRNPKGRCRFPQREENCSAVASTSLLLRPAGTGQQHNTASQSEKGLTPEISPLVSQKLTDHRQLLLPPSLHASFLTYLTISRLIHLTRSVLSLYSHSSAFTRLVFHLQNKARLKESSW